MRYAFTTGYLAAKSIIEKQDYISLLRNEFHDEFTNLSNKREILNKMQNSDYDNWVKQANGILDIKDYLNWKERETL